MERRINGYAPKSMKTARAMRLLTAHAALTRARKRVVVLLALAFFAIAGIAALLLTNGRVEENKTLILALLAVFFGIAVLAVLFFAVGYALYGGAPDSQRIEQILCRYIRGILGDTYRMYEREIIGRDRDRLLQRFALEYITDFRLLEGEREKLMAPGALAAEAEAIRRRYEDFVTYIISGDQQADRYITFRRNMAKVLEKWRHQNLPRYDKPQRAIIEDNIRRVTRTVTERYEYFLSNLGAREHVILMNDVVYHDITEEKSLWKPLPAKKKYMAFCKAVKKIEETNPGKGIGAGHGSILFDYTLALENYRQFTKTYATAECPSLRWDIEVYEEELAAAQNAQDRCWKCGEKYHPRFRTVRDKCKHYVCNKCEVCYCTSPQSRRRRDGKGRKTKKSKSRA